MAMPFQLFCPCQIAPYPAARIAASGNLSCAALSSCRQTTSGLASSSQRSKTGNRPFTPLTLKVAIFMHPFYDVAQIAAPAKSPFRTPRLHVGAPMARHYAPTRRQLLKTWAAMAGSLVVPSVPGHAQSAGPETRLIPSTGEAVPAVGLGTWITFNVGEDPVLRDESAAVMAAFFEAGGRLIDSSPMYGSSQAVVGYGLKKLGLPPGLFPADKVWTSSGSNGPAQIEQSLSLWGVPRFNLLQVHNLVAWEEHLQ